MDEVVDGGALTFSVHGADGAGVWAFFESYFASAFLSCSFGGALAVAGHTS